MQNLWIKLKRYWYRRPDTYRKVQEAYLNKNSRYLRNVYSYGRAYHQKIVLDHFRVLQTQKNFDFLMRELREVKKQQTKLLIYTCVLDYLLNEDIHVSDTDSIYLNEKLSLLDILYQNKNEENTTTKQTQRSSKRAPLIPIRTKMKDHIGRLGEVKRSFESY